MANAKFTKAMYKKPLIKAAENGILSMLEGDTGWVDSGATINRVDDVSFQVRIPGLFGPKYFLVKITEQI